MSATGLCLLGTDTGVGKTSLACGLLRLAARRGLRLQPFKPVETGCAPGVPTDGERLVAAASLPGTPHPLDPAVTLYRFPDPVAPSLAARRAGRSIEMNEIIARAADRLAGARAVLVETAGGVLTPYGSGLTSASIAERLFKTFGFDILLISANRLGTINHTALALSHLARAGLPLAGVVLVDATAEPAPDRPFNAAEIRDLTGARILGTLRHCPTADADALADAVASDVDVTPLLGGALAS